MALISLGARPAVVRQRCNTGQAQLRSSSMLAPAATTAAPRRDPAPSSPGIPHSILPTRARRRNVFEHPSGPAVAHVLSCTWDRGREIIFLRPVSCCGASQELSALVVAYQTFGKLLMLLRYPVRAKEGGLWTSRALSTFRQNAATGEWVVFAQGRRDRSHK